MDDRDSRMPASSSTIRMCGLGGIASVDLTLAQNGGDRQKLVDSSGTSQMNLKHHRLSITAIQFLSFLSVASPGVMHPAVVTPACTPGLRRFGGQRVNETAGRRG